TGAGNSPYSGLSTRAGNPLLLDLDDVDGRSPAPSSASARVDYESASRETDRRLRLAWDQVQMSADDLADVESFRRRGSAWLEDWALFAALKREHGGDAWTSWPAPLRDREPGALGEASRRLAEEIRYQCYAQLLFERQWSRVREAAHTRGIAILGDVPIYVALDSADVWARRDLFRLDAAGRPTGVAGVPPDYFSATGQLWGNPLYRWDRMAEEGYAWWIDRLRAELRRVDVVRLDHFRAFASYWAISAGASSAMEGHWEQGPG